MRAARLVLVGAAVVTTGAMTAVATSVASNVPDATPGSTTAGQTEAHTAVTFRPGRKAGTVEIRSTERRTRNRALALVGIRVHGGNVTLPRRIGTDFADPSVWRAIGAGVLCWAEEPEAPSASYTVHDPVVPFPAPPGPWRWSTVVVFVEGATLPVIGKAARAGDVFAMNGPVRRVIACVTPQAHRPRTGTAAPQGKPAEKVTICHRTNSPSNPYNLITVDPDAIIRQGHDGHTGPLFPEPDWGDVIPPFPGYPGMNWPAGQGLVDNECEITEEPVEPPIDGVIPPDPTDPPVDVTPPIVIDPPKPEPTPTPTTPTPTLTSSEATPTTATPSTSPTASTSSTTGAAPISSATGTGLASPTSSSSGSAAITTATSLPSTATASPVTTTSTSEPTDGAVITQPPVTKRPLPPAGEIEFEFTNGWRSLVVTVDRTFLLKLLERSGPCGTGRPVRSLPMGC